MSQAAQRALSSASPAATSILARKPTTNDSFNAVSTRARCGGLRPGGSVAPTSFERCAWTAVRTEGETWSEIVSYLPDIWSVDVAVLP